MKKTMTKFISGVAALALALVSFQGVYASTSDSPLQAAKFYYVSPTGNDTNAGTATAPFKTIQKAADKTVAGDTIILMAGSYTSAQTVTEVGAQNNPITIRGEGAGFNGGSLTFKNSQWLIVKNLSFTGGTNQITLQNSHYLAFTSNRFDYLTRGIYIQDYSSHILVEDNEFFQSCAIGKTWTQLKGSTCEGGAVYASSYGGGSYYIRGNWVHDSFNGFIFMDDTTGPWMNANVFISGNYFERIVDDPAEPEGDSFNFHVYNNMMVNTHRMVSMTTKGLGPVFVYNNIQITSGNPTNESSRLNSAFKIDLSKGYTNGVYIFNNTIVGENATNFYAYDMLSRTIATPLTVRNNIYATKLNAFNKAPSGGSINYDISKAPFGMTQSNGIIADPLVQSNGTLSPNSKAIGKSNQISIPTYFTSSLVVPSGANLGANQNLPAPAWVTPPSYPTTKIPANVNGWVETLTSIMTRTTNEVQPLESETVTATPTPAATQTTATATPISASPTPTVIPPTSTLVPATPTVTFTETAAPTVVPSETPIPTETTPTEEPSAELVYESSDPALIYFGTWETSNNKPASDGSFMMTTENEASVMITFEGTSFSVLYTGGPAFRTMDVYVDDVLAGSIDQKTDSRTYQLRWDYTGQLEPGSHVLKLVFVTDNTSGKTKGSIDAVIVR